MASACVNIGVSHSPDNFRTLPWLSSFSLDSDLPDSSPDFEFSLHHHHHPATMLPADELFSGGKLKTKTASADSTKPDSPPEVPTSPETDKPSGVLVSVSSDVEDKILSSPKAPKCSSRWREILGLKNRKISQQTAPKTTSSRNFLQKNSRLSMSDASLSLPLLNKTTDSPSDSATESSFTVSLSRLSLSSSSSSGHEREDLPRFSLDEKPRERPRIRLVRPKLVPEPKPLIDHPTDNVAGPAMSTRGVSMDSPRMNPAGKIVFQSLGRSSSSPSSLNGGPRYKYKGMERSYSANVRITPVLNVPVCSLRGSSKSGGFGFGQLFSSSHSQKKDKESNSSSSNGGIGGSSRINHHNHHRRKESS